MSIRDRIKEFRRVPASQLLRNEANWRRHPVEQRDAFQAVIREIGFAGACVAYEREDGSLELIDGHMRADVAGEEVVPVLVLDVTADEANTLLATFDPIGAMAVTDSAAQRQLLDRIDAEEAGLRKLLEEIQAEIGDPDAKAEAEQSNIPEMELQPHEHYDYVIVLARSTHEWNRLCELLAIAPVKTDHNKIGVGRGVSAGRLIALLDASHAGKPEDRRS